MCSQVYPTPNPGLGILGATLIRSYERLIGARWFAKEQTSSARKHSQNAKQVSHNLFYCKRINPYKHQILGRVIKASTK